MGEAALEIYTAEQEVMIATNHDLVNTNFDLVVIDVDTGEILDIIVEVRWL